MKKKYTNAMTKAKPMHALNKATNRNTPTHAVTKAGPTRVLNKIGPADAKVVSLKVRPFQATHLCFEVGGILVESNVELGAPVIAF